MKCFHLLCAALLSVLVFNVNLVSADVAASPVADHGPIGVMGEHQHKQGEWMTSYRYMFMDMPQNYSGTTQLSVDDVHKDFMVSPINMTMQMHMVGVMYGVTDEFTAMLMVPYLEKEMAHRNRAGKEFTTNANGLGDVQFSGLISMKEFIDLPVHLNMGVSFPTGSIDEKDETLAGLDQPLPYPMQLGSGTFDFLPGITYADKSDDWSWGAQGSSVLRKGKNDEKYRLGNNYELTAWIARTLAEWFSMSFRVKSSIWENIKGADARINPVMVPTADPSLRGGRRIDLFLGFNLIGQEGKLKNHRLAFEFGHPVYQDLDGPQLGTGFQGTVGWQKAF